MNEELLQKLADAANIAVDHRLRQFANALIQMAADTDFRFQAGLSGDQAFECSIAVRNTFNDIKEPI